MNNVKPSICLAARTRDDELLLNVTSGGVFSELAKVVLSQGGVVFGCAWAEDFRSAEHIWIDKVEDLRKLQGSKYVVSDMRNVYVALKRFLEEGRLVLFSGTPCQIAAVRKKFGWADNLLLCALFCMANINASVWTDFLDKIQRQKKSRIVGVRHRGKILGKPGSFFELLFEDATKNVCESTYTSKYWKYFSQHTRTCCRNCLFRSGFSAADLRIGDFWGVKDVFPEYDDGRGVSAVLIYSQKVLPLISRTNLELRQVSYEKILAGNPNLEVQYVPPPPMTLWRFAYRLARRFAGKVLRTLGLMK